MREHRIYHPAPLKSGMQACLDDNASQHVIQVLRLKTGDSITLFDGSGADYAAKLLTPKKNSTAVQIQHVIRKEPPAQLSLHLALGISRGERMTFSIQKAVELGVTQITPLFTQRTLVQLTDKKRTARLIHWQNIIRHACEQSGRSYLPQLNEVTLFHDFIKKGENQKVLLDHQATLTLKQLKQPQGGITLLVGPEGGLTPQERKKANELGFIGVRFGPRILRTETAPIAALAAIQTLWGDFNF